MATLEEYLDYNNFYDDDIDLTEDFSVDSQIDDETILLEAGDDQLTYDTNNSIDNLYDNIDDSMDLDFDHMLNNDELNDSNELDDLENQNDLELIEETNDIDDFDLNKDPNIEDPNIQDLYDESLDSEFDEDSIDEIEEPPEEDIDSIDNELQDVDVDEFINDLESNEQSDNLLDDSLNTIDIDNDVPINAIEDFKDALEYNDIPELTEIPKLEKPKIHRPLINILKLVDTCTINKDEKDNKQCFREYDARDTVGYRLRGNNHTLPVALKLYRLKLLFTSADGTKYIPASVTASMNSISAREVTLLPINPFGEILFYNELITIDAGTKPPANTLWTLCAVTLGHSFNTEGKLLSLIKWKPLYIKCTPNEDGSAVIDAVNPYVLYLPHNADGMIYIYLGIVYSTTQVELDNNHIVYYNDGNGIKVWTGKDCYTKVEINSALDEKQDTLISGSNIKTINNQTLLGSGNIEILSTERIAIDDIRELWKQFIIRK